MAATAPATESHRETWKKIALVMFGVICALSFRSWLHVNLVADGMSREMSEHLTFFFELPILVLFLLPLWKSDKHILARSLKRSQLSIRAILIGIGVGIAIRVSINGTLVAKVAFGYTRNPDPNAIVGPVFSLSCPPPDLILLHIVSLSLFVPVVEEIVNRGWLLSWLMRYGRWIAVVVSSLLFMSLHEPASMLSAFVFGLYLAVLYLNTGSLWAGIFAHCVSNALILLDWHCLGTTWNPTGMSASLVAIGVIALLLTVFALAFAALLVSRNIAAPECGDARNSN